MEGLVSKKIKEPPIRQTTRGTQGEHQVFEPPYITINISNKERGGPPKRMPSLEEPSPIAITCFKIGTTYTHCNTINILCL
jgi:hypothetical protein